MLRSGMDTKRTKHLTLLGLIASITINLQGISEYQVTEALKIPRAFNLEGGKMADALDVKRIKDTLDVCLPKIEQVKLSRCVIREKIAKDFMLTLKKHPVQQFSLEYSAVSFFGFRVIFNMLKNHDLEGIHLHGIGLGTLGAKCLAGLLREKKVLRQLDLCRVEMSSEGLVAIVDGLAGNNVLEVFNLTDKVTLEGKSAEELKEIFSKLLDGKENLSEINLSGLNMGSEGAVELIKALAENCPVITKINLARNKIGNKGFKAIAEMLPLFPLLEELILADNNIRIKGAEALAEVLPRCFSIKEINLHGNPIGNKGALKIANVLARTSLNGLVLGVNGMDEKGMTEFCEVLRSTELKQLWVDLTLVMLPCIKNLMRITPIKISIYE